VVARKWVSITSAAMAKGRADRSHSRVSQRVYDLVARGSVAEQVGIIRHIIARGCPANMGKGRMDLRFA